MNTVGKLSGDKAAEIIMAICDLYNISVDEATGIFYRSDTSALIDEGVADLHCRSPKYLAQCVWDEYHPSIEGALYLFPVGLSDAPAAEVLPQHNVELLRQVRHFVVENLRSARRFLKSVDRNINIDDLTLTELSEHTRPEDVEPMLAPLSKGEAIGVISEAGCPAVADPGADLVAAAQRKGYKVIPLVGPSSILLSLMASGFNGQRFAFEGYLPIDEGARTKRLKEMQQRIAKERQTQIFIETPYRNNKLIAELATKLPPQMLLCVASDITGPTQSIRTLPLSRWAKEHYDYNKKPTIFLLYSN